MSGTFAPRESRPRQGADADATLEAMAFEAEPTPEDYTAIAQIAREMLRDMDPDEAFDPSAIINQLDSGERAVVIREQGWQPNGHPSEEATHSKVVGWAIAHDRAEGRVNGAFALQRSHDDYRALCARLLQWLDRATLDIMTQRGVRDSLIVNESGDQDFERHHALIESGYERARTWLIMQRPLTEADAHAHADQSVRIRRILTDEDRRAAHDVLEESFKDHFNNFEETFAEFEARIELFPGHEWARDFLAEVTIDGALTPVGTLLTGWHPVSNTAVAEYLGVTQNARGQGVAKALFEAFFAQAHELGFARAELEVDATSPTGAHVAYEKLGFVEDTRVISWHKHLTR